MIWWEFGNNENFEKSGLIDLGEFEYFENAESSGLIGFGESENIWKNLICVKAMD